jgi:hypothetical protein
MARRKRNEGLLDLLFELPWWATLILGLFLMGVSGGKCPVALMFKMFVCLRLLCPDLQLLRQPARNAVRRWFCELQGKGQTRAGSSGVVRIFGASGFVGGFFIDEREVMLEINDGTSKQVE